MIWEYLSWTSICTGHSTIQGRAPIETFWWNRTGHCKIRARVIDFQTSLQPSQTGHDSHDYRTQRFHLCRLKESFRWLGCLFRLKTTVLSVGGWELKVKTVKIILRSLNAIRTLLAVMVFSGTSIPTLCITTAHALTCHSLGFGDVCFGHKIGQVILAKQRHLYQS